MASLAKETKLRRGKRDAKILKKRQKKNVLKHKKATAGK